MLNHRIGFHGIMKNITEVYNLTAEANSSTAEANSWNSKQLMPKASAKRGGEIHFFHGDFFFAGLSSSAGFAGTMPGILAR